MSNTLYTILTILSLLGIIIGLLIYKVSRRNRVYPGPEPALILGNMGEIDRHKLHHEAVKISKKYGPFAELWFLNRRVVISSDIEFSKVMMNQRPDVFNRSPKAVQAFLYSEACGLFDANGAAWAAKRKILSPAFTKTYIGKVFSLVKEKCISSIDKWKSDAKHNRGSLLFPDTQAEMAKITLDVAFLATFGYDASSVEADHALVGEMSVFFNTLSRWTKTTFPYFKYFYTSDDKEFVRVRGKLKRIIEKQFEKLEKNKDGIDSILKGVLGIGDAMPKSEKISTTMQFLVAGYHTTAVTLSIVSYLLGKFPEYQDRIRTEFLATCPTSDEITFDKVWKLVEVQNFVKEAMRLYPVVPINVGESSKPVIAGGKETPAGTMFLINTGYLAREMFTNGYAFDPDRWKQEVTPDQLVMATAGFGGGRRVCIGQNLAMTEMLLLTALLCANFSIKTTKDIDLDDSRNIIVVEPNNKIEVQITQL